MIIQKWLRTQRSELRPQLNELSRQSMKEAANTTVKSLPVASTRGQSEINDSFRRRRKLVLIVGQAIIGGQSVRTLVVVFVVMEI